MLDNPFPLADLQKILPVLALFAGATAALVIDLWLHGWRETAAGAESRPRRKWILPAASLLAIALAGIFLAADWERLESPAAGGSPLAFGGALRIDRFTLAAAAIILAGTLLAVITAASHLRRLRLDHGEFYALALYAAGAMILLAAANNLILIFLALETFSLAVYILTGYTRDEKRSVEGALKYFVLGGLSSGFLLLGLAFIFGAAVLSAAGGAGGALDPTRLDDIRRALQSSGAGGGRLPLLLCGLTLTLIGLGFKVGAFPFHSWIPDAYEGAPSLVAGFMAVTVKTAGFAALLRIALALALIPEVRAHLVEALWWLALGTMIFGNAVALAQSSVKRMLAYSAISHTGYLLVGVVAALAAGEPTGAADHAVEAGAPVVFYLLPYALMTSGAFAVLAAEGRERPELESFDAFRGLSQRRPLLALAMMLFMVSLAGLPPTAGFWGKLYLFREAVRSGHWPLALAGILTTILSAYYYLRVAAAMYMQPAGEQPQPPGRLGRGAALATAAAALGVIGVSFFPQGFLDASARAIASLWSALPR